MSAGHGRYVALETAISAVINAVFSAGFTWLIFGGRTDITLTGTGGVLIDFVPQTFMIALMSMIVPTLLTRGRVRAGRLEPRFGAASASRLPRNVLLRAAFVAGSATMVLGGFAALLLYALHPGPFEFFPLLALKVAYGIGVALIVTPMALSWALNDSIN